MRYTNIQQRQKKILHVGHVPPLSNSFRCHLMDTVIVVL